VLVADGAHARAGRYDNGVEPVEDLHMMAHQRHRRAQVAGVDVHLTAARLSKGERHLVTQPFEEPHGGHSHCWEQGVGQAGDEEGDAHLAHLSGRRRGAMPVSESTSSGPMSLMLAVASCRSCSSLRHATRRHDNVTSQVGASYGELVRSDPVDVLVVGAGPTGLTMAAEIAAHGGRPRVIDRAKDRVHESRALALQPRTLEVLSGLGVTRLLVEQGNPTMRLCLHTGRRDVSVPLFDLGLADTAYPFLLFLSQAETERVLVEHLASVGISVEREVELTGLHSGDELVNAQLRHSGDRTEVVTARYVVGCDGARSAVRTAARIGFVGSSYPQTFVLADAEAEGIAPDSAHAFLAERGILLFFPLGSPATWRLLLMRPPEDPTPPDAPVTLDEVQALTDAYTGGTVQLRDPDWMTNFRLHHRAATHYRSGRIFLAGDAAHIHSPAGGQGMNTGIQDAVNLGWKLAHALRGLVDPAVLSTYEPERAPVGAMVLRFTDRAFTIATSTNAFVRFARVRIAPMLIRGALAPRRLRAYAFRTVSELAIRYRGSALSVDGPGSPRRGPRAGDRLPDAPVLLDGRLSSLHAVVSLPGWHLLRCGPANVWTAGVFADSYAAVVGVHHLSAADGPGTLSDVDGEALRRLGLTANDIAQFLIRPDGHIGYRGGPDMVGLTRYLHHWLGPAEARA
jgi:2-polyprenyl-6-methoxyphenol hydroxylase-like FAD-dependent oxidoreductase